MVNVAEGIFPATCEQANLFTRNVLLNEELAQGDVWRQAATRLRTGNAFKNLELCSDRARQRNNGIYADISETTRARIGISLLYTW